MNNQEIDKMSIEEKLESAREGFVETLQSIHLVYYMVTNVEWVREYINQDKIEPTLDVLDGLIKAVMSGIKLIEDHVKDTGEMPDDTMNDLILKSVLEQGTVNKEGC
jgi:uncharacterized Fe-S cluster-containing MiaB family protein